MYFRLIKSFLLLSFFFLTNCVNTTTAVISPIITGAKTGSLYQASLSYSTNKIINNIKEKKYNKEITDNEKTLKVSENFKKPQILVSIPLDNVVISELFDPEPLP
tara:strand:- start:248 stop:562 length:315 start_codon:yes stop_codon:yes gene_type:complete